MALGWHVLLAGAVNQGKSAMMLVLADSVLRAGYDVAVVNLEMPLRTMQYRYYPILTGLDAENFERGTVNEKAVVELNEKLMDLRFRSEKPPRMFVSKRPERNLERIMEEMRWRVEDGVRVFFLDYLQLLKTGTSEQEDRQRVVEISSRLFEFAHEWDVLTVGLSQFARSTTREKKDRPTIEGMFGSASLEGDADQVLLLDHTRYEQDLMRAWIHRTYLLLAKNRHGGKGDIPFEWDWRTFRAREALDDEIHEWPGQKKGAP